MSGYELSRNWFNWSFDNPEKIKPIHSAIFFFAVEHQNRLGGKEKFGFPSQMTMDAIGVRKYQTYGKALNDLVVWGFIVMVEKSKNQYSANIIQLSAPTKNGIARGKALDKATIKHGSKQGQSNGQSTGQGKDSIDKPLNQEPITINIYTETDFLKNWATCRKTFLKKPTHIPKLESYERVNFDKAKLTFTKEQINTALLGLFKQENKSIAAMYLKPKHFLENISKYLNAELGKEYELYGKSEDGKTKKGGL